MKRKIFLTIVSVIATSIGCIALFFPSSLLESKGVSYNVATNVWMTETGLLLLAIGIMAFIVKAHPNSPTLKAFFIGNIIIQVGLFLIELFAYIHGVITKLSGIIPNLVLHILLTIGFLYFLILMTKESKHNSN